MAKEVDLITIIAATTAGMTAVVATAGVEDAVTVNSFFKIVLGRGPIEKIR